MLTTSAIVTIAITVHHDEEIPALVAVNNELNSLMQRRTISNAADIIVTDRSIDALYQEIDKEGLVATLEEYLDEH